MTNRRGFFGILAAIASGAGLAKVAPAAFASGIAIKRAYRLKIGDTITIRKPIRFVPFNPVKAADFDTYDEYVQALLKQEMSYSCQIVDPPEMYTITDAAELRALTRYAGGHIS